MITNVSDDARHDDPGSGQVTVRYWASIRAAAGVEEETLPADGTTTLAGLKARARERHAGSARFAALLDTCSVLVRDRPVASRDPGTVTIGPGDTVEFLPPFAGG
jgi:molybdopterin converting factor small subunit